MPTYLLLTHPYDQKKAYLQNFIPVEFESLIHQSRRVHVRAIGRHFVVSLDSELTQTERNNLQTAVTFYKVVKVAPHKKGHGSRDIRDFVFRETVLSIPKSRMRPFLPSKFPYHSVAQASPYILRFMVNVAVGGRNVTEVFDPFCSYGQILCDLASRQINCTGIDLDDSAWYGAIANVETFLRRRNRRLTVEAIHKGMSISAKEVTVKVINDDTFYCDAHLERVDAIVSDLPYAILTHARIEDRNAACIDIVRLCASKWSKLIRPSGRIVLAFNARKTSRKALAKALADVGFQPLYAHMRLSHFASDQIVREVFIAEKN